MNKTGRVYSNEEAERIVNDRPFCPLCYETEFEVNFGDDEVPMSETATCLNCGHLMTGSPYYHFLAVEYTEVAANSTIKPKQARALISTRDAVKIHWGDAIQWTPRSTFNNLKVLKDYGYPETGIERSRVSTQYIKDFPPLPFNIEAEEVKDVDGWLAPDGSFYRSYMGDHTGLAYNLGVGLNVTRFMDERYEDALYRLGWLAIGHITVFNALLDGVLPTDEQITFLKRLKELNEGFDHYVKVIDTFLKRAERFKDRKD